MESTLKARIIESLIRDVAMEDIERIAQQVRVLHLETVQTISAFVRLCGLLVEIKEEFGEKTFVAVLRVLGIDREIVEKVYFQASQARAIPAGKFELVLRGIANNTVKYLGLIGGNNGNSDR